ncbi:type I restriction endonuclease subunit M [Cystobacter fuscus]|uniref:site-specific DNA-methyltransferase (adenine-specific) n=1 Tax=Cystobacter fuscus TaxID=43 RepID=A0A250J896_9BACT|nr:class I SAM-dependent DNA methyltransferase [Cystobacter fuscus]ATB39416.1 type I restriction endonuclease subunit M [Cystobacter fuscus]
MAIKKSELYSTLWKSCDELRGGMDASQYKDYVLVLLFVKYVSDKAASQKNYDLDVPKGGSFADMVALKGDKEIGDKMNKIIAKLAEANDLKGVIDVADWNDADKLGKGKDMVDRLSKLVALFDNPDLDFRGNRAEGDDLLGDAYEYLMRHFATESGKSKGQFYTPAEVSRIMAKVIGVGSAKSPGQTIHDPTCGSGSLLIKAHDEAKSATGLDLALYGQEMDNATKALARMNLILHDCPTGEIWQDNTLSAPYFKDAKSNALKTFDFVVANPPFSTKAWTNGFDPANDLYGRFDFGVPPQKNGDYAFLLHIFACLKSTGKGAVILPHGVLFRGGAESTIRRKVVQRGYIKGIIGLPANLFYGTGIPACILVLDKEGAADRKGIFMVDASKGFIKDGNKNRLRAQDIHKIVDAFTRQLELPRYSRMVSLAEISDSKNDFNLNIPRYIDSSEPEDIQDIDGHLRGGIPVRDLDALDRYWKAFPGVREALFKKASRPGYAELKVTAADIKTTIFGHTEFTAWSTQSKKLFAKWRAESAPRLSAIAKGDKPKVLIDTLSEELLGTFQKAKLLDPYDVYQHLMDYWAEVMQDDVYLIVSDGWSEAAKPRPIGDDKEKKSKDKPDFIIGKQKFKAELIPTTLLIARHFAAEQAAIEKLVLEAAAVAQAMEELAEEHGGEDGLLAEAKNDKDKLTKASVSARLKEVKSEPDTVDERKVLGDYLALIEKEAVINATAKVAQEELTAKVAAKYGRLTEDDIKMLVVEDKWLTSLEASVQVDSTECHRRSLAAFVSLPNVMTLRYRRSRPNSRCLPLGWISTSRRWAQHGTEAWLQADRDGRPSG